MNFFSGSTGFGGATASVIGVFTGAAGCGPGISRTGSSKKSGAVSSSAATASATRRSRITVWFENACGCEEKTSTSPATRPSFFTGTSMADRMFSCRHTIRSTRGSFSVSTHCTTSRVRTHSHESPERGSTRTPTWGAIPDEALQTMPLPSSTAMATPPACVIAAIWSTRKFSAWICAQPETMIRASSCATRSRASRSAIASVPG